DFTDLNYPLRHYFIESIKRGELPLWASDISSGYPILAEGQIGALYPLNLLFSIFDTQTSVNLTIVISYFFIFLFSFLYFRKIGIVLFAAFFGATIVTFSGFAATQLMHFGMLVSFYLFLTQLWCLENLLQRQKFHAFRHPGVPRSGTIGSHNGLRDSIASLQNDRNNIIWIFLMGVLLGLSILGGHPQIITYSLVFLFPYWLFFWLLRKKSLLQLLSYWLLVISIGLGIGAGQILPQLELTQYSQRSGGLGKEDIYRFNFPADHLVNFVLPFWGRDMSNTVEAFQKNGWPDDERYVYMGIIGFGLLMIGVIRLGKLGVLGRLGVLGGLGKYGTIFIVTIIFSLLVSFGDQTPFGYILRIPPFSFFRLPFRLFFLLNLAAGGLVAIGVQTLLFRHSGKPKAHPESLRERSWSPPRFALSPQDDGRKSLFRFVVFSFLFLILFMDLFYSAKKLHPAVDARQWYAIPKAVSFLKKNLRAQERVTTQYYYYPSSKIFLEQPEIWQDPKTLIHLRNLLPAFNNLLYDIPLNIGAGNAAGLYVNRYRELENEVFFNGLQYKGLAATSITDSFIFMNKLMGTRYAIISGDIKHEGIRKVFTTNFKTGQDNISVYEFANPLPRAFVVSKVEQASGESIKNHLLKGDFNPRETIYIEEVPLRHSGKPKANPESDSGQARMTNDAK
ncbi:MAG: hypothetical protein HYT11_04675, partial [Candidatus Levybacteria bacterium]|nr:hypothetical protein [Candidatus Levybacteria bacterium]